MLRARKSAVHYTMACIHAEVITDERLKAITHQYLLFCQARVMGVHLSVAYEQRHVSQKSIGTLARELPVPDIPANRRQVNKLIITQCAVGTFSPCHQYDGHEVEQQAHRTHS